MFSGILVNYLEFPVKFPETHNAKQEKRGGKSYGIWNVTSPFSAPLIGSFKVGFVQFLSLESLAQSGQILKPKK